MKAVALYSYKSLGTSISQRIRVGTAQQVQPMQQARLSDPIIYSVKRHSAACASILRCSPLHVCARTPISSAIASMGLYLAEICWTRTGCSMSQRVTAICVCSLSTLALAQSSIRQGFQQVPSGQGRRADLAAQMYLPSGWDEDRLGECAFGPEPLEYFSLPVQWHASKGQL